MNRTLFIFLVVLALVSGTFGKQCGLHEEFNSCGSACEPTCIKPKVTVCTFQCYIGCQCKDGYLRNSEGMCVLPEEC